MNLKRLGLEKCEVCGQIGLRFTAEPMIARKLAATHYGWLHPTVKYPDKFSHPPDATPDQIKEAEESAIQNVFLSALAVPSGPPKFCLSDKVAVETFTGGQQFCPKCGERGQGERDLNGERRFWHSSDRSCYLGMVNPKRPRKPETECPKCGKMGRPFKSGGYEFIRHETGQCRIGKGV